MQAITLSCKLECEPTRPARSPQDARSEASHRPSFTERHPVRLVNVKAGNFGAVIFYLKAKCGWRDSDPPGGVNVNLLNGAATDTLEAEKARAVRRRALIKLSC